MYELENQSLRQIGARIGDLVKLLKKKGVVNDEGKMNDGAFSKSIGMDPGQFSRLKSGEFNITLKQLLEISSIYGVRINWMITGEEPIFIIENKKPGVLPGDVEKEIIKEVCSIKASLEKLERVLFDRTSEGTKPAVAREDLGLGNMEGEGLEAATKKPKGTAH